MCDAQTLTAFLVTSLAIILAPGPAQALVLARTLEGGRSAGILTAVGLNAATLVHALVAGLGLSALLATSAVAFAAVKIAGAAYLVLLGILAFSQGPGRPAPLAGSTRHGWRSGAPESPAACSSRSGRSSRSPGRVDSTREAI